MKLKDLLEFIEQEIMTQLGVTSEQENLTEAGAATAKKSRAGYQKGVWRKKGSGRQPPPGGPNQVKAASKGTVGKVHGRKLPKAKIPKRDKTATKIFNTVADGGKEGRKAKKDAQKLAGAQGAEWPAGVWAIATDKTIKGKGASSAPAAPAAKAQAKKAQAKAVKAVGTDKDTPKSAPQDAPNTKLKRKKSTGKKVTPGKTYNDPKQGDFFGASGTATKKKKKSASTGTKKAKVAPKKDKTQTNLFK